jgi:hypothetical protein
MLWLIVVLVVLVPILAIVLDSSLGRALARRVERPELGAGAQVTAERLAFLEGEVERLSSEVGRLDEESEFLHKLLTERAGGETAPRALSDGEGDDTPR